ncbi:MAG: DUF2914 domain-containing protein [Sandaracinaceae bacterium]
MKTQVSLIAGGITGSLAAVGMIVAVGFALGGSRSSTPLAHDEAPVPTVPTPALHEELATTTPTPRVEPPIVAPAEAPLPPPRVVLRDGAIRVRRLVLARGIDGHEPVDATDEVVLGAQPRLYAFVEAVNETGEDVELTVTFEPVEGESTGHVALSIPAASHRYRTWAWTRHIYHAGAWDVVVRDDEGRVIARRAFDVVD